MAIGEMAYLVSKYMVWLLLLGTSIYGGYATYYAYVKRKDERQRYIVLLSAVHAFLLSLLFFGILFIVQIILNVSQVSELRQLGNILRFGINGFSVGTACSWMIIFLGICLFRNKKKMGGRIISSLLKKFGLWLTTILTKAALCYLV